VAAKIGIVPDCCGHDQHPHGRRPHHRLEFWESDATRPTCTRSSDNLPEYFETAGTAYLKSCMEHPFLPEANVKQKQLARIKELVKLAYSDIPV
jgi:phenylacetate-CoA ligase